MSDIEETIEKESFDRNKLVLEIGVRTAKLNSLSGIDFINDVLDFIENIGYTLLNSDVFGISFSIINAEDYFTSKCNRNDVPAALYSYALQYVAGDFLSKKLASGNLEIGTLDLSSAILTSIEMGDVKESFDKSSSDRTALDSALQYFRNAAEKEGVLKCHTKVRF